MEEEIAGNISVAMPRTYAYYCFIPNLPMFLQEHPKLEVQIILRDEPVNLVQERIDMGIQLGNLPSSSLVAKPVGQIEYLLVATDDYLEGTPSLQLPTDLNQHNCIVVGRHSSPVSWDFHSEQGHFNVETGGTLSVDDEEASLRAALANIGIALLPTWMVIDHIKSGNLQWLLPNYYPTSLNVQVTYQHQRFLSRRIRSMIDFVSDLPRYSADSLFSF